MNTNKLACLFAAAALSLGLAACGGDNTEPTPTTTPATPTPTVEPTEPVAEVTELGGRQTELRLGADFVAQLKEQKVELSVRGEATEEDPEAAEEPLPADPTSGEEPETQDTPETPVRVLALPITGGSITVYEKDGPTQPFVQGEVEHRGAGLVFTSGRGQRVEFNDLVYDPDSESISGSLNLNGEVEEGVELLSVETEQFGPFELDGGGSETGETGGTAAPEEPGEEGPTGPSGAQDEDAAGVEARLEGATLKLTGRAAEALAVVAADRAFEEQVEVGSLGLILAVGPIAGTEDPSTEGEPAPGMPQEPQEGEPGSEDESSQLPQEEMPQDDPSEEQPQSGQTQGQPEPTVVP